MNQLVFYWSGDNNQIPTWLVKSTLLTNKEVKIIQISDNKTNEINGVSNVIRVKKSEFILMDRIFGYSLIDTLDNKTLFIDADTIILKKIDFDKYSTGNYLFKRTESLIFDNKYNLAYPELAHKDLLDTMPIMAGTQMIINEKNFFKELYLLKNSLSLNLKKWFGDQILLKKIFENKKEKFKFLDKSFLRIVEKEDFIKGRNLILYKENNAVTFKGNTKKYMENLFFSIFNNNK